MADPKIKLIKKLSVPNASHAYTLDSGKVYTSDEHNFIYPVEDGDLEALQKAIGESRPIPEGHSPSRGVWVTVTEEVEDGIQP